MRYPAGLKGGRNIDTAVMAIDILPTLAAITGSELPETFIDGKSVWELLKGDSKESPQKAYYFYYRVNELHAVRYGKWKLYSPHNYRTMEGQQPGKDGLPGNYVYIDLNEIELYDLSEDPGESKNVAAEYPKVTEEIEQLADSMRIKLGDSLKDMEGTENRPAGTIE